MPPGRKVKPRSAELAALGSAIQQVRRKANLSQEALADAAGIHLTHLGGIERGVRNPSYSTLLKVTAALDIRVGALTTLADRVHDQAR